MHIIKVGRPKPGDVPIYVPEGLTVTCLKCNSVLKTSNREIADNVILTIGTRDPVGWYVKCPVCKSVILIMDGVNGNQEVDIDH